MNPEIHKCAEVGDVVDNAWEHHPFAQVVDVGYRIVEFHHRGLFAGVASRLFKLRDDVGESCHARFCIHISREVGCTEAFGRMYEFVERAPGV